jgi:hypothetical protein
VIGNDYSSGSFRQATFYSRWLRKLDFFGLEDMSTDWPLTWPTDLIANKETYKYPSQAK